MTGGRALVGASSDIGRAVAVDLAAQSCRTVLWGRNPGRLTSTARACTAHGPDDVVDVVFDGAPAHWADPETWAGLLDVNLTAAAVLSAMVLPALVAAAPSALVLVGSGAGRRAYPGNAAYVARKHGLAGLAWATFLDVRDLHVKVSVVSPGLVAAGAGLRSDAGQQRPEQLLSPDDVAAAVRFVVSFPVRGCPVEIELPPQRTP